MLPPVVEMELVLHEMSWITYRQPYDDGTGWRRGTTAEIEYDG